MPNFIRTEIIYFKKIVDVTSLNYFLIIFVFMHPCGILEKIYIHIYILSYNLKQSIGHDATTPTIIQEIRSSLEGYEAADSAKEARL